MNVLCDVFEHGGGEGEIEHAVCVRAVGKFVYSGVESCRCMKKNVVLLKQIFKLKTRMQEEKNFLI